MYDRNSRSSDRSYSTRNRYTRDNTAPKRDYTRKPREGSYHKDGDARNKKPAGKYRRKNFVKPMKVEYSHTEVNQNTKSLELIEKIPPIEKGVARVMLVSGVEEIGRNMAAVQYGDDIVLVDCGLGFSDNDMPGISYILPNTHYLETQKDKIRGLFITHGHLDHIGGIAFLIDRLGTPPIYSRALTNEVIKHRHAESIGNKKVEFKTVDAESIITVGEMTIKFFTTTHTIPDSMGIIIQTPSGNIVFTGDIKLDHTGEEIDAHEIEAYKVFKDMKTHLLLCDSTNVENPGFSIAEKDVWKNLDKIISSSPGRIILGTFASQIARIISIIQSAEKNGRKVALDGLSMRTNIGIAKDLGLIKTNKDTFIDVKKIGDYPKHKILILATGAQGDKWSSLVRAGENNHQQIKIESNDTIVLSSSVVPGNELAVQKLKDNLSRSGAHIVTYQVSDVHASGHGNRGELAWIHSQIRPQFFSPVHGYRYMLSVHADLAAQLGMPKENIIIPDDGTILELRKDDTGEIHYTALKQKMPNAPTVVDGSSVNVLQRVVLQDRRTLAEEGVFMIVLLINSRTRRLKRMPDIFSRGFVYLRESQDLIGEVRDFIRKDVEDILAANDSIDIETLKSQITTTTEKILFKKTLKHPLVLVGVFFV